MFFVFMGGGEGDWGAINRAHGPYSHNFIDKRFHGMLLHDNSFTAQMLFDFKNNH